MNAPSISVETLMKTLDTNLRNMMEAMPPQFAPRAFGLLVMSVGIGMASAMGATKEDIENSFKTTMEEMEREAREEAAREAALANTPRIIGG